MLDNIYYSYYPIDSSIHKSNPTIKLLIYLIMIIDSILLNNISLLVIFTVVIVSCVISFVPFKYYLRFIYSFRYLFFSIILITFLFHLNIYNSSICILIIINLLLYGVVIVYTTSMIEIVTSITKILKPLKYIGININKVAIFIGILFQYPAILINSKNFIAESESSRGFDYRYRTIIGKFIFIILSFFNIIKISFIKISIIKKEMRQKLFIYNDKKTNIDTNKITMCDIPFLLIIILSLIYSIIEVI